MKKKIIAGVLCLLCVYADQTNLDMLLGSLQQAEDLSKKTIQESAGYVITYTREDLDRMHIKSLKEILERLPFIRYNEDANGLTDLFYEPFQPTKYGQIKLYIDDKETSDAIFGNSLQAFSEMDISFIDHIEIYLGAVSFTLGTEPSITIIKLYTKDPARENSAMIDIGGGSRGKKDFIYLNGRDLGDMKYLFYVNHRDNRRKKIKFHSTELSRDKKFNSMYFLLYKDKLRYELFVSRIDIKPFTAGAINLEPKLAHISTRNFFTGLRYDDPENGWHNYLYFTYSNNWAYERGNGILGVLPQNRFLYLKPYKSHDFKATSTVTEVDIKKKFQITKNWSLLTGITGKAKHFEFLKNRFDNIDFSHLPYNQENLVAGYIESSYLLNNNNVVILDLKKDKYFENGPVDDYDQIFFRTGYIYNSPTIVTKFFLGKTDLKPSPKQLLESLNSNKLKKQTYTAFAWELQKKDKKQKFSILYTWMQIENLIIRDIDTFKLINDTNNLIYNTLDIRYCYKFDLDNKMEIEGFIVKPNRQTNPSSRNLYGAHIMSYNKWKNFNFFNSLVYRRWTKDQGSGFDYSFTVNYRLSDKLSFYFKGLNIFGSAIKTNYYGYDMVKSQIIKLSDVDVIDREFLVGMEYQF
ncbi:TonB-dependent receptor plug domain-containing protein [Nitratiruptor sp. YY09-18]|uniref:TonB-dependent receptor plug domain-containing protein n=1 Tax=Nitratiruptor sp. YY09-18 TaxID=2724901 RepID=UPI001915DE0F|nr:TonB-dependent receptor plug domain-containing protein [Nitratiruptor sp. YY09-18]BCD68085.1 iron complex outermembrane recepter protein [Nitratiruptor sp. YY09-18]